MKPKTTTAIAALRAQLAREQKKAAGLTVALQASKSSRDMYRARWYELRRAGTANKVGPTKYGFDSKYEASYEVAKAHVQKYWNQYQDGDKIYFYTDPKSVKVYPIQHPIVEWRVIKIPAVSRVERDEVDLEFVEEIQLVA